MTTLELELSKLKESILDMAELSVSQMTKTKEAFLNMDKELAEEIIHYEKRMNALEVSIDRECENILALLNPVASDLRFVFAALKLNSDFERIGDYCESIASYVADFDLEIDKNLQKELKLSKMFDKAISMIENVKIAFENEDTSMARKLFKKDADLNQINTNSSKVICDFVKDKPSLIKQSLFLFSVIKKLERVGDHVTNIAEDLIFYQEAQVLKHKKLKKKLK